MALEQSAWELMAIGMGLLKDREVLIDSARLLSIVVRALQVQSSFVYQRLKVFCSNVNFVRKILVTVIAEQFRYTFCSVEPCQGSYDKFR